MPPQKQAIVVKLSGQLEDDVHQRGGVRGLPIALRGPEANLLGSVNRRLIQTVTETLHDTDDTKLARSLEHYLKYYFSFDPQISGFGRISRSRFGNTSAGTILAAESSAGLGRS